MLLTAALATLLLSAGGLLHSASAQSSSMPLPFTRELQLTTPLQEGQDIYILQNMLSQNGNMQLNVTSQYDTATELAVSLFQRSQGLAVDGIVGPATAQAVLDQLSDDRYRDDGVPPAQLGYLYKVYVPVYRNRSVETMASLIAANGTTVFQFQARLHGIDTVLQPWPYFNSCCNGLNVFSDNGDTPTGLIELDLNTPEPDPVEFGPYPINRAVLGLRGNAGWLIPGVRNGILIHTGAWSNYSDWQPPMPMPNSEGCIHSWPQNIYSIWQLLVNDLGVVANNNTQGALPYPYKPQGLLSIEQID